MCVQSNNEDSVHAHSTHTHPHTHHTYMHTPSYGVGAHSSLSKKVKKDIHKYQLYGIKGNTLIFYQGVYDLLVLHTARPSRSENQCHGRINDIHHNSRLKNSERFFHKNLFIKFL